MTKRERLALEKLLEFVTSGRRYESRNPYCIDEVKEAMAVLEADNAKRGQKGKRR
jgi:hypothetical protein